MYSSAKACYVCITKSGAKFKTRKPGSTKKALIKLGHRATVRCFTLALKRRSARGL